MATKVISPNRMELTRLKKKHAVAKRGHKLLKDKQDELMRQFLELAKENYDLREVVEKAVRSSSSDFALARAAMDEAVVETALITPGEQITVEVNTRKVMSIELPEFSFKGRSSGDDHIYAYGLAFTSADLDDAVKNVHGMIPSMLKLAEIEKKCQLMSREIEKTRRRVNALEHVVIPETQEQIRYIRFKLDENERSAQIRLMKVKDMILEKKYNYSEK